MGEASLAGLLENTAHALCNVEVGKSCFAGIVSDVVGHAVLETALADRGVLW